MNDNSTSDLMAQARAREWFYDYELPDGSHTATYHKGGLQHIHDTRWTMLRTFLDQHLDANREAMKVIDLACHQGWFAWQMARAGFGQVTGIDARQSHVDDSSLIASIYGMNQLAFQQGDVHQLSRENCGQHDVVMMLGLLYHLENPIGALRTCRDLCSGVCVIETQVVPGITGWVDYGSYEFVRPLKGSFGIIDEVDDTHGPEASITGISLVPSLEALLWILDKVGFSQVAVLPPPADAYEQLRHHKRVMVVAHV